MSTKFRKQLLNYLTSETEWVVAVHIARLDTSKAKEKEAELLCGLIEDRSTREVLSIIEERRELVNYVSPVPGNWADRVQKQQGNILTQDIDGAIVSARNLKCKECGRALKDCLRLFEDCPALEKEQS